MVQWITLLLLRNRLSQIGKHMELIMTVHWLILKQTNASMMVVSTCTSLMALKNWHALRTWPCSLNAILSPCRGTTLTVRPASTIKSYKNGVFSFTCDLDLFVLLEVSIRLMFIIRLKCVELAELALWLRLELGLCCLLCERPKTRSTFFCSENTRTSSRSWRSCCSDYCTILPDSRNKGCA